MFGRPLIFLILLVLLAVGCFFIAQWLIPLLFDKMGADIPPHIANILAMMIAVGVVYAGWARKDWPPA